MQDRGVQALRALLRITGQLIEYKEERNRFILQNDLLGRLSAKGPTPASGGEEQRETQHEKQDRGLAGDK